VICIGLSFGKKEKIKERTSGAQYKKHKKGIGKLNIYKQE